MKTFIKKTLWFVLNYLDPVKFKDIKITETCVTITFIKDYHPVDEWFEVTGTFDYWVKINKKGEKGIYTDEIYVYRNAKNIEDFKYDIN